MTLLVRDRLKFIALICALALLRASSSFAGDKPFTEVRSPNFRVLTNGNEHDARRIALEFEQMRAVFAIEFPKMRLSTGAPLLILPFARHGLLRGRYIPPARLPNPRKHVRIDSAVTTT